MTGRNILRVHECFGHDFQTEFLLTRIVVDLYE